MAKNILFAFHIMRAHKTFIAVSSVATHSINAIRRQILSRPLFVRVYV